MNGGGILMRLKSSEEGLRGEVTLHKSRERNERSSQLNTKCFPSEDEQHHPSTGAESSSVNTNQLTMCSSARQLLRAMELV